MIKRSDWGGMRPPSQYTKIWCSDWKYLIILDACRYDYFEKVFRNYPFIRAGKLEKVYSCGSRTPEWFRCTFKDKVYDGIIYVSANPHINSKGIHFRGFSLRDLRFHKVIDVWDWGWSEELGTVHPKEVNKAAIIASKLYPHKRFIIHYIQPHYPYLSLVAKGIGVKLKKGGKTDLRRPLLPRIKRFIRRRLVELFGDKTGPKLAIKLVGPPSSPRIRLVARRIGIEGLKRAYEHNLRVVLSYVSRLVEKLRGGKIVITSDHGELLGERGMYGHPPWMRVPELIEVPWLELECPKDGQADRIPVETHV